MISRPETGTRPAPSPAPIFVPPKSEESPPIEACINGSAKLSNMNLRVTDLTISPNYGNDLKELDLSRFKWLRSIDFGHDCFGSVKSFNIVGLDYLKTIIIGDDCFESVITFNMDRLNQLKTIIIGDDCFKSVMTFKMDRLNQLKTIKIGNNSCTQMVSYMWDWDKANNKSKSFYLMNCESLESIQIGEYSFSDFAGECILQNLPQLQSIRIGTIGRWSGNFCCNSLVIRGIELILNIEYL